MGHSTSVLVPCSCFGFRPSGIPKNRAQQPPTFRPMSIVTKQSYISATAEHLLYILVDNSKAFGTRC